MCAYSEDVVEEMLTGKDMYIDAIGVRIIIMGATSYSTANASITC